MVPPGSLRERPEWLRERLVQARLVHPRPERRERLGLEHRGSAALLLLLLLLLLRRGHEWPEATSAARTELN